MGGFAELFKRLMVKPTTTQAPDLVTSEVPGQTPDMTKYLQLLRQAPSVTEAQKGGKYAPSPLRRIGSVFEGLSYGKPAQEEYLAQPYMRAYQDWAQKMGQEREAISFPQDIRLGEAKIGAEEMRKYAELARREQELATAREREFETTPKYLKERYGAQPGTFAELEELTKLQHPYKPDETEREENNWLKAKGVDPAKATPQQRDEANQAITARKRIDSPTREETQQRSWATFADKKITAAAPKEEQYRRVTTLLDTLNYDTPATDAVVAPEVVTVVAGGAGTGVRITQPEINAVIGGRTVWEDLQARLAKYRQDPSKGFQITPVQREQLRYFINIIRQKMDKKMQIAEEYSDKLLDPDVKGFQKGRIANEAVRKIREVDNMDFIPSGQGPKREGATLVP